MSRVGDRYGSVAVRDWLHVHDTVSSDVRFRFGAMDRFFGIDRGIVALSRFRRTSFDHRGTQSMDAIVFVRCR